MKKFLILMLVSLLSIVLFSNWIPVQAQSPDSSATDSDNEPALIDISFNPETDSHGYIPDDLEIYSSTRGVIGEDNRQPLLTQESPWTAIGRLEWVGRDNQGNERIFKTCTATLVGRDIILTNSHCMRHPIAKQLVDRETYQASQEKLYFVPFLKEGKFEDVALVTDDFRYGWQNATVDWEYEDVVREDWALLRLNKSLGDKYGSLGWRNLDFNDPFTLNSAQETVYLAGYSGDYPNFQTRLKHQLGGIEGETASIHRECSINQEISGVILHDCDTMGGASGSALIAQFIDGNYYIIGLHHGWQETTPENFPPSDIEKCQVNINGEVHEIDACRNVAVPVSRWSSQAFAMQSSSFFVQD